MEWLRMINKTNLKPFMKEIFFIGEAFKWLDSLDEITKLSPTWENV
jgi:hypothetical protein